MNARIAELEDLAEQARLRASKLEKEKNKLTVEIRELTVELETVSALFVFPQQKIPNDVSLNPNTTSL